jgi:glycosyltransferase involved in cell wall biosynthesis
VSAPLVSVVIPARDAEATLTETLEAVAAQRFPGVFEVIVVDDGSRDATAAIASAAPAVTRIVRSDGVGPGRARNVGAAAAAGAQLAFLDADCRPAPDWLAAGSQALALADLVLGETRPRPDRALGPFDRTLSVVGCSPLFESANLFVRRDLFAQLGGFESWLGPRDGKELGEDAWFGWRARRTGARITACPQALAHHEVFARTAMAFVAERWRLRFFPALTRRIPELRRDLLYGRVFLNHRAAKFDAAIAGLALSAATRRPAPAALAIPYARVVARDLRGAGGLRLSLAGPCADAVGLIAMLAGGVRYRSVLL